MIIITEDYPKFGSEYSLAYIHTRVKNYKSRGIKVTVISFSAKENYEFDGVQVQVASSKIPKKSHIISHAPNLRNHVRWMILKWKSISSITLWFHGHEIMNILKEYPKPYAWVKNNKLIQFIHKFYSPIKFFSLKLFIKTATRQKKLKLVFVSEFMLNMFKKNINDHMEKFEYAIIPNPVHNTFISLNYAPPKNKIIRGFCIRPWDNSKYAVDLIIKFASYNPNLTIDIYGSGIFPRKMDIPFNVKFIEKYFMQNEIPSIANLYDFAIYPTRLDAQGVAACELATYGMPLITNDIPIMHEMLDTFENVYFIKNSYLEERLNMKDLNFTKTKNMKFSTELIIKAELNFLYK